MKQYIARRLYFCIITVAIFFVTSLLLLSGDKSVGQIAISSLIFFVVLFIVSTLFAKYIKNKKEKKE